MMQAEPLSNAGSIVDSLIMLTRALICDAAAQTCSKSTKQICGRSGFQQVPQSTVQQ